MKQNGYKIAVEHLLKVSGITINGPNAWDVQVLNENFYKRVLGNGSLGLGEAYMDGWWDAANLDELVYRKLRAKLENKTKNFRLIAPFLKAKIFNYQNKPGAVEVAEKHYDVGNELYSKMLGPTMVYTCGYWKDAKNLEESQIAKMDLVCRKMGLKPGMKVLDLGCGFGGFMKFAAEKYKVNCVGLNISKEQVRFGQKFCQGLPVEFRLIDYREAEGMFDRIVAIGLTEHVGYKNYGELFKVANSCLKDGGLFLLHTIGNNESITIGDPWISKYIFPNGMLPSIKQLSGAMEKLFILEDLHNFGTDYEKTLMAWFKNFDDNWDSLKNNYDDRFYRMWKYYLLQCAGIFRARKAQLWQLVLSKNGVLDGYNSIR